LSSGSTRTVGVQTLALLTELFDDFSCLGPFLFHGFDATVTAVVVARFVVVRVVAVAVSLVLRLAADRLRLTLVIRVEAFALLAELRVDFPRLDSFLFHRFGATVAAIVITRFVVVWVITVAVSLELRLCACGRRLTLVIRVEAFALTAEILLHFSFFRSFGATVTAIVVTRFVVVFVVAVAVSLELRFCACGRLCTCRRSAAICTLTRAVFLGDTTDGSALVAASVGTGNCLRAGRTRETQSTATPTVTIGNRPSADAAILAFQRTWHCVCTCVACPPGFARARTVVASNRPTADAVILAPRARHWFAAC